MKSKNKILTISLIVTLLLSVFSVISNAEPTDDTLQSKIAAATDGETIILDKDYVEDITIDAGKKITIDLGGHSITAATTKYAIQNKGDLTITGTGNVNGAVVNYPKANANLNGGTYYTETWYAIKNMGTMVISNANVSNSGANTASVIDNGWYGSAANDCGESYPTDGSKAELTITGGTFEANGKTLGIVKNDDYGKLTINNGTFKNEADYVEDFNACPTVLNWNIAEINGGTFTSKNGVVIVNGYLDDTADVGKITINGGTFESLNTESNLLGYGVGSKNGGALAIKDGTFKGKIVAPEAYSVSISGGTFNTDVSEYVEEGLILNDNGVVENKASEEDVARLEEELVKFETAIKEFNDKTEEIVTKYPEAAEDEELKQNMETLKELEKAIPQLRELIKTEGVPESEIEESIALIKDMTDEVNAYTTELDTMLEELDKAAEEGNQQPEEKPDGKVEDEKKEDGTINPKTGDSIVLFVTIFAIATLGTILTIRRLIKRRK